MKKLKVMSMVLIVFVVAIFSLLTKLGAQEVKGYSVVSATELKGMQDSGKEMLIIDALASSAYKQGHIPGAKNFEFPNGTMDSWDKSKTAGKSQADFVAFLGQNKDKPLVFY